MSNDNQDYDMSDVKGLKNLDDSELEALNQKIIDANNKKKQKKKNQSNQTDSADHNDQTAKGMRIASEIIASPVAGGILGYLIDQLFGTHPAFLIILIILGIIGGFYRAYKLSQ
jgi:ATP synthase protein I